MRDASQQLLDLAGDAIRRAKAAGAQDVVASAFRSRDVGITFRDGSVETVKDATSRGLSLRLYVDGRYSAHDSSDLRPGALQAFVEEAVALTRSLEPDPDRVMVDPVLHPQGSLPDLELDDRAIDDLTRDQRVAWLQEMDAAAHGDPRVLSATCDVADGHELYAYVTSTGFSGSYVTSMASNVAVVTVQDADDKKPEDYAWSAARHVGELPPGATIASEALRRALDRVGAVKGPTRKTTMVVEPRAAVSLVARLLGPMSARAVQQHTSMYAGKVGERLFSELLTLTDDPLLPRALGSRPFDGEGLASHRRTMIDRGVLSQLYVDTYYGRKAGLAPNGGAPSNLRLEGGQRDADAWMREVGDGILVTSWLGGNADGTTGDFSMGCRGFLIEGGQRGPAVQEMNVTGNLLDLFRSLRGVGADGFAYASLQAPTLVFSDVSFSGA
jgi:PmbA protein